MIMVNRKVYDRQKARIWSFAPGDISYILHLSLLGPQTTAPLDPLTACSPQEQSVAPGPSFNTGVNDIAHAEAA